jgi:hypothetical protein
MITVLGRIFGATITERDLTRFTTTHIGTAFAYKAKLEIAAV